MVCAWAFIPDSTRIHDSLGRVNVTPVAHVMSSLIVASLFQKITDINCNFMEKRYNIDPLDSLCLPILVPTVVKVLFWDKQKLPSHGLHVFSAPWMPTRPRSKSQQCNCGYKARTEHSAALSRPASQTPAAANQIFISHLFVQSVNIPQLSSLAVFTLHTKVTEQSSPTWSERNSLKWGPVVVRGRREA